MLIYAFTLIHWEPKWAFPFTRVSAGRIQTIVEKEFTNNPLFNRGDATADVLVQFSCWTPYGNT